MSNLRKKILVALILLISIFPSGYLFAQEEDESAVADPCANICTEGEPTCPGGFELKCNLDKRRKALCISTINNKRVKPAKCSGTVGIDQLATFTISNLDFSAANANSTSALLKPVKIYVSGLDNVDYIKHVTFNLLKVKILDRSNSGRKYITVIVPSYSEHNFTTVKPRKITVVAEANIPDKGRVLSNVVFFTYPTLPSAITSALPSSSTTQIRSSNSLVPTLSSAKSYPAYDYNLAALTLTGTNLKNVKSINLTKEGYSGKGLNLSSSDVVATSVLGGSVEYNFYKASALPSGNSIVSVVNLEGESNTVVIDIPKNTTTFKCTNANPYDVNNDGTTTSQDISSIQEFSYKNSLPMLVNQNCTNVFPDVNNDGKINSFDMLDLLKYLESK